MSLSEVVIRTEKQVKAMNPLIVKALEDAAKKGTVDIPVVYQYLHQPGKPLKITSENTIGRITSISKTSKGAFVGNIEIVSILMLASNYEGVIDNIAVSMVQGSGDLYIDGFIVYDKSAKLNVIEKRKRNKDRGARTGEIPFATSSTETNDIMKKASEALINEFNKKIAEEEQSDKNG